MNIKWNALAQTAGVSFLVTVAVVAAFALGTLALAKREAAVTAAADGGAGSSGRGMLALAAAGLCFASCLAAVGYGLSMIAG